MKHIKSAVLSSTILAGLLATSIGAAPALAQETTAVPAANQETALPAADAAKAVPESANQGDIIVTARKRAESLLQTPISITALTSEAISARGIVSVNDLVNSTPGINVSNISSGRSDRSFQQISLRGFTPSITTSTLVATFIDGVPVASATAVNSVTDPERIEILKGPQSAYFGRNTFAGAVNVVNKLPSNDLGGRASGQWGTRNNLDFLASLEGAIVPDKLLVRVSGRYYSKDGSYNNVANPAQTLGAQRTKTGTALIVAKPFDGLTIKGFGLLTTNHDGPSAQGFLSAYEVRSNNGVTNVPYQTGSTAGTVIIPSVSNCNLTGYASGISSGEARVVRPFICGAAPSLPVAFSPAQNTLTDALVRNFLADGTYRVVSPKKGVKGYGLKSRYYHLHLNVDYEIGESGLTVSSLTGYNNEYYSELADLDNYDSRLLTNPANLTGTNPNLRNYWDFPFLVERYARDFSQEGRISYDKGGRLKAVLGASYLRTRADGDLPSGNGAIVGGLARPSSTRNAPQKAITLGAFFGVTYDVTSKITLNAEGRYQQDRISAYTGGNIAGLTVNATNTFGLTPGTFGPLTEFYSKKFRNFLPRAIAQYHFDRDTMAYASYSKGANIGLSSFNTSFLNGSQAVRDAAASINLGVVVKPEKLDNYEIGLKGKLFDGKVRGSLAAYYAIWKNQQNPRSTLVQDQPSSYVAGQPCPATYTCVIQIVSGTANSGKSIIKGLEADVTILPFTGLSIDLAAALNDSDIRSFTDPSISKLSGVIGDGFRGNQAPGTSKYSANMGVQYGSSIHGQTNMAFFVRGDLSYKSKIFADPANLTWIKSRTQVNFRGGLSKGPVSIEAFLTNAFDNHRYTSIANNAVLTPNFAIAATNSYLNVGLPELRTFGLRGAIKF